LSHEDEAKFKADDNLFRGAVINALDTNFQKSYIILLIGKELWDALVGKFGVTMLVVSCISWSSCMTTKWLRNDL